MFEVNNKIWGNVAIQKVAKLIILFYLQVGILLLVQIENLRDLIGYN